MTKIVLAEIERLDPNSSGMVWMEIEQRDALCAAIRDLASDPDEPDVMRVLARHGIVLDSEGP